MVNKIICMVCFLFAASCFGEVKVDIKFLLENNKKSDTYTKNIKFKINKKVDFIFPDTPYKFSVLLEDRTKQYPQTAVKTLGTPYLIKTTAYKKNGQKFKAIDTTETVAFSGKEAEVDFSAGDSSYLELKFIIEK